MKKILIPIFVVLALGFCYLYYNNSIGTNTVSLVSQNETSGSQGAIVVGAEIISLLDRLDAIKLDTSLFSEATFQSLKDFSIVLRSQAVGRSNPFAPIGNESSEGARTPASSSANQPPASPLSGSVNSSQDSTSPDSNGTNEDTPDASDGEIVPISEE